MSRSCSRLQKVKVALAFEQCSGDVCVLVPDTGRKFWEKFPLVHIKSTDTADETDVIPYNVEHIDPVASAKSWSLVAAKDGDDWIGDDSIFYRLCRGRDYDDDDERMRAQMAAVLQFYVDTAHGVSVTFETVCLSQLGLLFDRVRGVLNRGGVKVDFEESPRQLQIAWQFAKVIAHHCADAGWTVMTFHMSHFDGAMRDMTPTREQV